MVGVWILLHFTVGFHQQFINLLTTAEDLAIQGKLDEVAPILAEAVASLEGDTDPRVSDMKRFTERHSYNIERLTYDAVGEQHSLIEGSAEELGEVVAQRLRVVQDYDSEIMCLRDMERVDTVLLGEQIKVELSEVNRLTQELNISLEQHSATLVTLTSELTSLQQTYRQKFNDLSTHIVQLITAERDRITKLANEIREIRDNERRKAIIGGIFAGLKAIVGVVACVFGAPEVGVPLIIGAAIDGVQTARQALQGLPPVESRLEETRWCQSAIADADQLTAQANAMTAAWEMVNRNGDSTFAEKIPELFLLTLASDRFEAYITTFQTNLVQTAGTAGVNVASDAAMLTHVVSLSITTFNQYYRIRMTWQHEQLQTVMYEQQVESLRALQQEGSDAVATLEATIGVLQTKRRSAVGNVLRLLNGQKRLFTFDSLSLEAADSLTTAVGDDTSQLQSIALNNLQTILRYDHQHHTIPQSCWTTLHVTSASRQFSFQQFVSTGEMSFFLQPPELAVDTYAAHVTEIQVYFDLLESSKQKIKAQVIKGAANMKLNENGDMFRYIREPHVVEVVYDHKSWCPLSSAVMNKKHNAANTYRSDGSHPSLYGLWVMKSFLTPEERRTVSGIRIFMKVHYHTLPSATKSYSTEFRLFDDSDTSNGVCGAVNLRCRYDVESLTTVGCALENTETDTESSEKSVNKKWVWAIAAFSLSSVAFTIMIVWLASRIRLFKTQTVMPRPIPTPTSPAAVALTELENLTQNRNLQERMRRTQVTRHWIRDRFGTKTN
eukprot:c9775_g4_i1.p1 GENE.c9775_g4_i1~~c9775_g4_i1.p1  ORF type:complete len:793 (+),score=181.39 c9775_g4_i1:40-2379(+)